jgi:hypothetical protein
MNNEQLRLQAIDFYNHHLARMDAESARYFIAALHDMNEWRAGRSSFVPDERFNELRAAADRGRPRLKVVPNKAG